MCITRFLLLVIPTALLQGCVLLRWCGVDSGVQVHEVKRPPPVQFLLLFRASTWHGAVMLAAVSTGVLPLLVLAVLVVVAVVAGVAVVAVLAVLAVLAV